MTARVRALPPSERIDAVGHRAYVGGDSPEMWYGIGRLQFHYLVSEGLRPEDRFLDIACGALRLGQFLIPYLNEGNYFGLDSEEKLIRLGSEAELKFNIMKVKKPHFSSNCDFNFSFIDHFDFAMAQSLFTHLTLADIDRCFRNLRPKAFDSSRFFLTFREGDSRRNPTGASHAHMRRHYSFQEIADCAAPHGWRIQYIGNWGHPRNQMMAVARLGAWITVLSL